MKYNLFFAFKSVRQKTFAKNKGFLYSSQDI